jgi:serine/threonine protein kinase
MRSFNQNPGSRSEYVEGVPLRQVCRKALSTAEGLAIRLQIAEALAAAHAAGTVHGDIKPENILLRCDYYVKVLDFGLSRKVSTETIAAWQRPSARTLRYMSPEQATGKSLKPATDIFSFGLVLYTIWILSGAKVVNWREPDGPKFWETGTKFWETGTFLLTVATWPFRTTTRVKRGSTL